jgi:2-polyprenyl-6-methoxyphenol hydroxylase-like FAD-dependent oxidoreductase
VEAKEMTPRADVGVVGAGLGGLAVAGLLARHGFRVVVLERAPQLGPCGAGILLHPSGTHALQAIGIADQVLGRAEAVTELVAVRRNGRTLSRLRYGVLHPGLTGHGVARDHLFRALLAMAERAGAEIATGAEVVSREETAAGILLADRQGRRFGPFQLVVGADGSRSAVRGWLPAGAVQVHEDEQAVLWAVGPCHGVRHRLLQVVDGTRELLGVMPHGHGEASLYWGLLASSLPNLHAAGFAAFRTELVARCPEVEELLAAVGGFAETTFATYRRVAVRRWAVGRLVLLGDAAHAMPPYLGQGANLALADAVALARALTLHADLTDGCRAYARERQPVVARYALLSRWLAPFFQSRGRWRGALRDASLPHLLRWPGVERAMVRVLVGGG